MIGNDVAGQARRVSQETAPRNLNAFCAHEFCGQCAPCLEGSSWMKKITIAKLARHLYAAVGARS